jgi:ketosteroid isomerase-like protein
MPGHRPLSRIVMALAFIAGGLSQAGAAQPHRAAAPPARTIPLDESSYRSALGGLTNYQTCGVDAAALAGLNAQMHAIEAAARAKGLGPTIDRVRQDYLNLLAVSTMTACGGGPVAALADARRGIAAFQAWVAGAAPVTLTPAERQAEVVRAIVALEEAYEAAEIARDEAALRRVLDEHFVPVRPDGKPGDRLALLAAMGRTTIYREEITERHVTMSGDAATVTGIVAMTYLDPSGAPPRRFRFTESYRSRDGVWRLAERSQSDRPLP